MSKLEELNKMFERMEDIEAVQAKVDEYADERVEIIGRINHLFTKIEDNEDLKKIEDIVKGYTK